MFVIKITIIKLLFFYAKCSVICEAVSNINSEDFVFPLVKSEDFSKCIFQNGSTGQCVNASQCPKVRYEYQSGINPTLCYFDKNDPIVCCMSAVTEPSLPTKIENKVETTTSLFDFWSKPSQSDDIAPPQPQPIPSEQLLERRKSAANCDFYSLPVPYDILPGEVHATVVGGQVTLEGEFPHMAALGWTDDDNNVKWRCGGTLISLNYILTAAHCLSGTQPDIIRVGEKDLINVDTKITSQDFGIELIVMHPEYTSTQLYNDIALIKLNKSVVITTKVRPACLWQEKAINFTDVTATGYGHTSFGGKSSNELLKVDLKIFSNDECSEGYKDERSLKNGLLESQLCAGDSTGEKDTCQGDSGGPIQVFTMKEEQIVYHIVGVTSFGKACATTLPGVYTRVSNYLDWIENIVWDELLK